MSATKDRCLASIFDSLSLLVTEWEGTWTGEDGRIAPMINARSAADRLGPLVLAAREAVQHLLEVMDHGDDHDWRGAVADLRKAAR